MPTANSSIPRHKTAIRRGDLSRPMKCALESGMIDPAVTVFDYGCGHGQDVALLTATGIDCAGWDPVFAPEHPQRPADVVNLGYVINVIEDPAERASTLRRPGTCASDCWWWPPRSRWPAADIRRWSSATAS